MLAAGLFVGGALDHAILALAGREESPYGLRVGVRGNLLLGGLDLVVALGCWAIAHRLEDL